MAGGTFVGALERDGDLAVVLNDAADAVARANDGQKVELDILVMQVGRSNFGNQYDLKGLVSGLVLINRALPPLPHSNLHQRFQNVVFPQSSVSHAQCWWTFRSLSVNIGWSKQQSAMVR